MLTSILTFPYAPVRLVTWVAQVLLRQAEQELYGPGAVRRRLEELDEALASGAISEADHDEAQRAILEQAQPPPAP